MYGSSRLDRAGFGGGGRRRCPTHLAKGRRLQLRRQASRLFRLRRMLRRMQRMRCLCRPAYTKEINGAPLFIWRGAFFVRPHFFVDPLLKIGQRDIMELTAAVKPSGEVIP